MPGFNQTRVGATGSALAQGSRESRAPSEQENESVRLISVEPLGEGWAVRLDPCRDPILFQSGSSAEDAAKTLGQKLAQAGYPTEIRIFLRGGDLAGRFICSGAGLALCSPWTSPTFMSATA